MNSPSVLVSELPAAEKASMAEVDTCELELVDGGGVFIQYCGQWILPPKKEAVKLSPCGPGE